MNPKPHPADPPAGSHAGLPGDFPAIVTPMTNGPDVGWIESYIWGIADDVLRDVYVRGKYRDVILPMTVLRRLDAVLEPTKQAVLDMKAALDSIGVVNQKTALWRASGEVFNRYFYKPKPMRTLEEIRAVEREAAGLLEGVLH